MTKYKITNERGAPRLHMGEREVPAVLYGLSDIPGSNANTAQAQRNIANFAAAGIDLVCADTGLHIGWRRVTEYDTEVMREEISSVLEANPKVAEEQVIFIRNLRNLNLNQSLLINIFIVKQLL